MNRNTKEAVCVLVIILGFACMMGSLALPRYSLAALLCMVGGGFSMLLASMYLPGRA